MKKFNTIYLFKSFFVFTLLLAIGTACSNSASGEHEEHPEAEGFRIKMNGDTVVEKLPDEQITNNFPAMTAGEESPLISIYFIDHDGDEFQPNDPDLSLIVESADPSILAIEQHAEDGKWSFHLHAEAEGTTSFTADLYHGDHADFESGDIAVTVNAATN